MAMWKQMHGKERSDDEILQMISDNVDAMTDRELCASEGQNEYNLRIDKDFLKATKTIFPFTDCHGRIPEMARRSEI
jgi:hypothetical protein